MLLRSKAVNYALRRLLRPISRLRDAWLWRAGLRRELPPFVKYQRAKYFQKAFGGRIFVETGTYLGDMVNAVKHLFEEVYSIELDPDLATRARRRFRKDRHVHIIQGDSSKVLFDLLPNISAPKLIWLDAHFSGGITTRGNLVTPIVRELEAVRASYRPGDVLLIDDAASFNGRDDYPDEAELRRTIEQIDPQITTEIVDSIVCAYDTSFMRTSP